MTQPLTEGQYTGEFLLSEVDPQLSRENVTVTVAPATTLAPGTVLGRLTATGKYVPYDNAGGDGSDVAAAILYSEIDNSEGEAPADFEGVVIARLAAVRKDDLQWASGLVDADKTAAYADLAAVNIIARD